ncbi:MAG TPA: hypothetical protein HA252_05505 [Candidatus Diapherotrites archaeon]|uniref:Uncharacterized protein n=1 Tax=Candidatus Iainarchaeum sp. TaxID=3101447 RepID=A0A7J4JKI4_9ARCH|nr:hypothetical protein [Candidatus Diapherotrites archaeon]HIH16835.1 hypothetical protein [Candidatus Diapherotrites archaeon]
MNERGAYSAVMAVLAVALLGLTLLSVKVESEQAANLGVAYDARPVWVNALALAQDKIQQSACADGGRTSLEPEFGLLEEETGFRCTSTPAEITVKDGVAAFELACEKTAGELTARYARRAELLVSGCQAR